MGGAGEAECLDVVVVGAGFAGLYMLHRLRGLGLSARVYEAGDGVGGTWYWNRYPGARVDIESQEYSYSFSEALEDEWEWTERYAGQPELLRYLNSVAERFDLMRDIRLGVRVTAARFDEASARWTITTDPSDPVSARFCVMATGCLTEVNTPPIQGLEDFCGTIHHTARWPKEGVDFTGRRVGVIGTGSSGIQSIPRIAEQAKHLHVFQRTPNFSLPANNGPLDPGLAAKWRANRAEYRRLQRLSQGGVAYGPPTLPSALAVTPEERRQAFEDRWRRGGFALGSTFADLLVDKAANDTAVAFVGGKIREVVEDPKVAEILIPRTYPFGTKRLCIDTDYFETFNRPNVTLVDVAAAPIERITPTGLSTAAADYGLDALVFATGFDAMTGALGRIDIRGRGDASLKEAWAAGPRTYLGLMVAGFPNLFSIAGPGSPSVISNMVVSIEQHVDWIADCLTHMRERGLDLIEATPQAQDAWVDHVNKVAAGTLYMQANSWYLGANIPGKPRVFMPYVGGVGTYRKRCEKVAANGYEGFELRSIGSEPCTI